MVALQAGLINSEQFNGFIESSLDWDEARDGPYPALLVQRGWIRASDTPHLEYLVERKLKAHAGDAGASLITINSEVKCSLEALGNPESRGSKANFSPVKSSEAEMPQPANSPLKSDERYALSHLHAIGGIGQVWLARDRQLGRDVALKELRPDQAENATLCARFLKEAQITGQLEHPGIVPVYELARRPVTGKPFYTMRFLQGKTLNEAAVLYHQKRSSGEGSALDFSSLLNAFVTVCKTVAYAHSRGVIHRDLKGQNVIVGDFGEVVVLDWGLAKLMSSDAENSQSSPGSPTSKDAGRGGLTLHGDTLGTPAYMAPEQAAGHLHLIDQRTDVYGLGAILYHVLTGRSPFSGGTTAELLHKVQTEQPIPPQQLWADVPGTLQSACLRALSKQRWPALSLRALWLRRSNNGRKSREEKRSKLSEPPRRSTIPWWRAFPYVFGARTWLAALRLPTKAFSKPLEKAVTNSSEKTTTSCFRRNKPKNTVQTMPRSLRLVSPCESLRNKQFLRAQEWWKSLRFPSVIRTAKLSALKTFSGTCQPGNELRISCIPGSKTDLHARSHVRSGRCSRAPRPRRAALRYFFFHHNISSRPVRFG